MTPFQLFETNKNFAETIDPRMASFNHPSPCTITTISLFCFPPLRYMRPVSSFNRIVPRGIAAISFVGTKIPPALCFWLFGNDGVKRRTKKFHVVSLGAAHDNRERDAMTVHQQAAFAPFFFPDPLDFYPQPPEPRALSEGNRLCFAIPTQSLPFHRIPPIRFSKAHGKNRPFPIPKNTYESNSRFQIGIWVWLSIEFPFAEQNKSLQKLVEQEAASGHHQVFCDKPAMDRVAVEVLAVPLWPRMHPTPPRNTPLAFWFFPYQKYCFFIDIAQVLFTDKLLMFIILQVGTYGTTNSQTLKPVYTMFYGIQIAKLSLFQMEHILFGFQQTELPGKSKPF